MTTDGDITRAIDNRSLRRGFGDRIPSNFWEVQIPFNPPLSSHHHHLTQPSLTNATAERENSLQTRTSTIGNYTRSARNPEGHAITITGMSHVSCAPKCR